MKTAIYTYKCHKCGQIHKVEAASQSLADGQAALAGWCLSYRIIDGYYSHLCPECAAEKFANWK